MKHSLAIAVLLLWIGFSNGVVSDAYAVTFKVLVVMSYEKPSENPWCKEIKEGIDSVLGNTCKTDYFYMNTKRDFKGGEQRAGEAFALYSNHHYDGVIAVDDNAQSMFVVPFLKDSVKTPVMFCGVNADPVRYGYPASNVSGIIERGHVRESIAFLKQLVPAIRTVGFLVKDSPSGNALKNQVESESTLYPARVAAFELLNEMKEIESSETLKSCDAIFIDSIIGISDSAGKPVVPGDLIPFITNYFRKPVIGANNSHVEAGALCAVVKTGQEQGEGAAGMLLKAMQGTPVSKIPITRNFKGKRIINVTTMRFLSIDPKPISLLGAELIK